MEDYIESPRERRQTKVGTRGTRREAEGRFKEDEHMLNSGCQFQSTDLSVSQYIDVWLRDYAEDSVSPRTLREYHSIISTHIEEHFGSMKLKDLEARHVQEYYAQCIQSGLPAQTVQNIHRLFHQLLRQAVLWEILQRNVLDEVVPPSGDSPEMHILTSDEIEALLRQAQGTDYFLPIHLALYTGMRRGEILGLQLRDVDMDNRTIRVSRTMVDASGNFAHISEPKTSQSRRTLPISEETAELLRSRFETGAVRQENHEENSAGDMQVCRRASGRILTPRGLSRGFRQIAEQCGLGYVRFHELRSTYAGLQIASGVRIQDVQQRLGLAGFRTPMDLYGHLLPDSDT